MPTSAWRPFSPRFSATGGGAMMGRTTITINPKGKVVHLRTKQPVEPRLLDGKPVTVAAKEDPRKALAAWMTAPENPYFAGRRPTGSGRSSSARDWSTRPTT